MISLFNFKKSDYINIYLILLKLLNQFIKIDEISSSKEIKKIIDNPLI